MNKRHPLAPYGPKNQIRISLRGLLLGFGEEGEIEARNHFAAHRLGCRHIFRTRVTPDSVRQNTNDVVEIPQCAFSSTGSLLRWSIKYHADESVNHDKIDEELMNASGAFSLDQASYPNVRRLIVSGLSSIESSLANGASWTRVRPDRCFSV